MARLALAFFSLFLLQCTAPSTRQPSGSSVVDESGYLYDPADKSCDGFPRLQVETMPGTCLGLVLPKAKAKGWVMPRSILSVPGTRDFLVTDMGGWAENKGGLYLLRANAAGTYENVLLKGSLNMPHALRLGPDGFFYIGETHQVSRFHLADGKVRDWELVVAKLPKFKGYMHPLVALAFDPRNGDLYINAGSPSDHCYVKDHGSYSDCPEDTESGLGGIYRVPGAKLKAVPAGGIQQWELAASGLRNSMALEVHPSGWLVQGENGRDFPQLEEPYEELNAIELDTARGRHFGWPYCYDFHAVSPEWKFPQNSRDPLRARFNGPVDCAARTAAGPGEYQPPHILMPPHVAPLHLGYYPSEGQLSSLLGGRLIVTWHGHQPTGHRLVAYNVDSRGLPRVASAVTGKETFSMNVKGSCPVQKPFKPEGGNDRFSQHTEIISGWNAVPGIRPKGAPVTFAVASDGSIFLTEDKNKTIVRLARFERATASNCGAGPGNANDPRIELLAARHLVETDAALKASYESVRTGVLQKYCASCHGSFQEKEIAADSYSELDFLVKNEFLVPGNSLRSKIYQALSHSGEVPAMPPKDVTFPEGAEGAALVASVKTFIEKLPDYSKTVKRQAMKETRKLRAAAGSSGKECGQVGPGDIVYLDPRPEAQPKKDGWLWTKVYVIPGDTRLFKDICPYPVDGVFWMGINKL